MGLPKSILRVVLRLYRAILAGCVLRLVDLPAEGTQPRETLVLHAENGNGGDLMKCKSCGRDMSAAGGCGVSFVVIGGKRHQRIKCGDAGDMMAPRGRCGDCGVARGQYHHVGCDLEACPVCGEQLISCSCDAAFGVL